MVPTKEGRHSHPNPFDKNARHQKLAAGEHQNHSRLNCRIQSYGQHAGGLGKVRSSCSPEVGVLLLHFLCITSSLATSFNLPSVMYSLTEH